MSVPYQLNPRRTEEVLSQAVKRRTPVALSVKTTSGWVTFRTRLLGMDATKENLVLEYPAANAQSGVPEIMPLQTIGVTFRRGHKKCMFNTAAVARCAYAFDDGLTIQALKIAAPGRMFELQRRVFYRTPVAQRFEIDVQIWRETAEGRDESSRRTGRLVDVSAGGLSVEVPADQVPDWPPNTPANCSLVCSSPELLIEAPAQFRHLASAEAGKCRVGLQFSGLEATPEGRRTLQRILDLTSYLQTNA